MQDGYHRILSDTETHWQVDHLSGELGRFPSSGGGAQPGSKLSLGKPPES